MEPKIEDIESNSVDIDSNCTIGNFPNSPQDSHEHKCTPVLEKRPTMQTMRSLSVMSLFSVEDGGQPDEMSLHRFVLNFVGIIVLLIVMAGILIGISETFPDTRSDTFADYSNTVMFGIFSVKILTYKWVMRALKRNSALFNTMSMHHQERTVTECLIFVWVFFWVPVGSQIAYHVFENVHLDPFDFMNQWGSYAGTLLKAGLLDQLLDLVTGSPAIDLYLHHYAELFCSLLLLDFLPLEQKSPGIYIMCLVSAYDRFVHFVFPLTWLLKQRDINLREKQQFDLEDNDDFVSPEVNMPVGCDILLPNRKTLSKLCWYGFIYYLAFLRVGIIVAMTVFYVYQWAFLERFWKILYPIMVVAFIAVDYYTYVWLYKNGNKV